MFVVQQLISGLEAGASYGLLGLAIVIVMKSTDVPNFAMAEMGLLSCYVCWSLISPQGLGLPFAVGVVATIAFAALLGIVIQLLFIRPFTGMSSMPLALVAAVVAGIISAQLLHSWPILSEEPLAWIVSIAVSVVIAGVVYPLLRYGIATTSTVDHFPLLLMTIGLTFVLDGLIHEIWSAVPRPLGTPWTGGRLTVFGATIGYGQLVTIGVALVVALGVGAFFKSTWGVRMRAIAEDGNTARLLGIRASRVSMMAWALGGAIGFVALMLKTSQSLLEPAAGSTLILAGFIAATLGGFTSLAGTFLGGLIVGVAEALAGGLIDTRLQPTIALLVVVAVLLLSSEGLSGEKKRRQV
jgi:branched-chain amino acid transport system permease protein